MLVGLTQAQHHEPEEVQKQLGADGLVESFDGRLRHECLNETLIATTRSSMESYSSGMIHCLDTGMQGLSIPTLIKGREMEIKFGAMATAFAMGAGLYSLHTIFGDIYAYHISKTEALIELYKKHIKTLFKDIGSHELDVIGLPSAIWLLEMRCLTAFPRAKARVNHLRFAGILMVPYCISLVVFSTFYPDMDAPIQVSLPLIFLMVAPLVVLPAAAFAVSWLATAEVNDVAWIASWKWNEAFRRAQELSHT